jgi:hypothetical protein
MSSYNMYKTSALCSLSTQIHFFCSANQSLSLTVCCSSVATLSAYLFAFPENDIACASRQPIIFTSLSLIGALLSTRAWRIGSILSPAVDFASSAGGEISYGGNLRSEVTIERTQAVAMNILTRLSTLSSTTCGKSRRKIGGGIRREVGTVQLLLVTGILIIPQSTLQILNIALPAMRATSTKRPIAPFVIGILLTASISFLPRFTLEHITGEQNSSYLPRI